VTTLSLLEQRPTWILNRASARAHRLITEGFASAGFRGYDYRLLAAVAEFGPASQAELGRRAGIDRSDVVASLSYLAARGLVERTPDVEDRRRNVISMTRAGARQLTTLDSVLDSVQERLLAPLSERERTQLIRLLSRLSDGD
jgi:MarR family transcriptional regulator, lower aerobic nicotinate degradation pathway regulator